MNEVEIKSNRTNNDIESADIYENKQTKRTVRVLSAGRIIEYVANERIKKEDRLDFLSNHKFKRRG